MDFLKNITLDLRAAGPAAVVIVWIICVTVLGILGKERIAWAALAVLNIGGAFVIYIFGHKVRLEEFKAEIEAIKEMHCNKPRQDGEAKEKNSPPE